MSTMSTVGSTASGGATLRSLVADEPTAVGIDAGLGTTSPALAGRLIAREALAASQRDAMFALMVEHFRGVERIVFDADLAEKDWVILLEDSGREGAGEARLCGFSTLSVSRVDVDGIPRVLVYSGDTIVDRAAWGTRTLPRLWIGSVMRICEQYPTDEIYWLLLTSGFRTYRFLPVFFRWFHPRHDFAADAGGPAHAQVLLDTFARHRFGALYDAPRGIVRFPRPQVLQGDLLAVPEGRRADPHVTFFLERNPGFVRGDELVSLTRISRANLTPAGRRMLDGPGPNARTAIDNDAEGGNVMAGDNGDSSGVAAARRS